LSIRYIFLFFDDDFIKNVNTRVMSTKTTLFVAISMIATFTLFGQKELSKAAELVQNGQNLDAISLYESYLVENPHDFTTMMNLGAAYNLAGQYGQSIFWYGSIPKDISMSAEYYTSYGNVLKRVGRYNEAMEVFDRQAVIDPIASGENLAACQFAVNALSATAPYDIELLPLNSAESDLAMTFYKGTPVFTSFRKDILLSERQQQFNNDNGSQRSYTFQAKDNKSHVIVAADGQINHIGPLTFSNDGATCAYVYAKISDQNTFNYNNKSATLFIAKLNANGEITSAMPFEHNEAISSINSASLAYDGMTMYFSSNREGGIGGYDIYVTNFDNGKWSLPVNLGSDVNTGGDEITPFYKDGKLYFASDRWPSIGGFDIQVAGVVDGVWTRATNVGAGFNSMGDEYFPYVDKGDNLYVTSNRLGGRGNHDIYKVSPAKVEIQELVSMDIPKAVSLEALENEIAQHTTSASQATAVSNIEPSVKIITTNESKNDKVLPVTELKVDNSLNTLAVEGNVTVDGAHRIAISESLPVDEVFFIQLASISASRPNFSKYKPLVKYGNIYKMINNKAIKVRLGYFDTREEAENILSQVRTNGFTDAFLTLELLNTAKMELILSSSDEKSFTDDGNFNSKSSDPQITNFNSNSKYKVRLASYEDPTWFDIEKVRDLGRVEQWTKGTWTIFVLAGYGNINDAKKAAIAANNRGYKTAEVVIDNGGILERIKQN
jgi:tetratricopeptide (TPR) repeat protein